MKLDVRFLNRQLTLAVLAAAMALPAAAQVVVTPGDLQGFLIGPGTAGPVPPFAFVEGPGAPPVGTGSFSVQIVDPNSKVLVARDDSNGLPISSLSALAYHVWVDPASTNLNPFYVNLYIDSTGAATAHDMRLDFAPPTAMVGVWQQFDALVLPHWRVNGADPPDTLANHLAAFPNARLAPEPFAVPGFPAVVFNMGDTASSYVGFDGALDRIEINQTVYDLELVAPALVPAIPTAGTWGLAALAALLGFAALRLLVRRG